MSFAITFLRALMLVLLLSASSIACAGERAELLRHRLGSMLSFEAEFEAAPETYRNLDLDRHRNDTLTFSKYKFTPTLLFKPAPMIDVMLEVRWDSKRIFDDPARQEVDASDLSWREAYVIYEPEAGTGALYQLGRHRFRDDREWLFDEFLDTVRVLWRQDDWLLDLSQSAILIDPKKPLDQEKIVNTLIFANHVAGKQRTRLFTIHRDDRAGDWRATWYGLQARGEFGGFRYHIDGAGRRGQDGTQRLAGHGWDGAVTWTARQPWQPSLTLGYAYGSGDASPQTGADTTFKQTGLEDNHGKIAGVDGFQYYGVVLDPKLSNIAIATLAAGIRPTETSSVELVWHGYRRNTVAAKIKTQLAVNPGAQGEQLGNEIDLLLAYKGKGWRGNLAIGRFRPGNAYRGTADAWGITGEVRLLF